MSSISSRFSLETPDSISTLIYEAKGNVTDVTIAIQDELKQIGPTIRQLQFNQESFCKLRKFEWTAQMVAKLVEFFPNLEQLNFDGSLIRELDGFFDALKPLKSLKNLSMNDITLKDRHIDELVNQTRLNAITCSLTVSGIEKKTTPVFPRLV